MFTIKQEKKVLNLFKKFDGWTILALIGIFIIFPTSLIWAEVYKDMFPLAEYNIALRSSLPEDQFCQSRAGNRITIKVNNRYSAQLFISDLLDEEDRIWEIRSQIEQNNKEVVNVLELDPDRRKFYFLDLVWDEEQGFYILYIIPGEDTESTPEGVVYQGKILVPVNQP